MANNFSGELLHFGAIRMRVSGAGNLITTMNDLDGANTDALPILPLVGSPGYEPLILSDFQGQRGQLTGYTLQMNEYFSVSKIVVFVRPVASGLPQ